MGIDIAKERKRSAKEKTKREAREKRVKERREKTGKVIDSVTNAMIGKEICTLCGNQGRSKKYTKGSFIIEMFFWLIGLGVTVFTFGAAFLVLIVPLSYSLWRVFTRYKGCPQCQGQMIRTDSPVGQKNLGKGRAVMPYFHKIIGGSVPLK